MKNNKDNMLVSIVIPTYNSCSFLIDCLKSIFNQTYKNIEVIIVDDGSTDNTQPTIRQWQSKIKNLIYIRKENGGISSALNAGIEAASGVFIARMDADDICYENRIFEQVKFLNENKAISLVSSSYTIFSEGERNYKIVYHPHNTMIIKLLLCYCSPICHPGVMARTNILKENLYSLTAIAEDHELWCRLAKNYKLSNIDEPLIRYRKHESSLSLKKLKKIRVETLANGFIFFKNNRFEIKKIPWKLIREQQKEYPNLKWGLAYFYRFLATITW